MAIVYKLTDANLQTYGGFQYEIGKAYTFPGDGPLCSPAWSHAYESWQLGLFMNPIHADFSNPRLFECEGVIGVRENVLKLGCSHITLVREMPIPAITTDMRVEFAIRCAMGGTELSQAWVKWAEAWLRGENRSRAAAASQAAAISPSPLILIATMIIDRGCVC